MHLNHLMALIQCILNCRFRNCKFMHCNIKIRSCIAQQCKTTNYRNLLQGLSPLDSFFIRKLVIVDSVFVQVDEWFYQSVGLEFLMFGFQAVTFKCSHRGKITSLMT